jgi:hypothetical protein
MSRYRTVAAPNSFVACTCNENSKGLLAAIWNIHMEFGGMFQVTGFKERVRHTYTTANFADTCPNQLLDMVARRRWICCPPLQLHRLTCPGHLKIYFGGVDITPNIGRRTRMVHGLYR